MGGDKGGFGLRVLFIGTVDFSLEALEKMVALGGNVVGVCTKGESSYNSDFCDLTPFCRAQNIPYKLALDINSRECIDWMGALQPDVIFCFGWSSLIKQELLGLPRLGVIGFHPTLLPMNRGRHPIIWSLALGLAKSGTTFFRMDEGADTGDILSQKEISIELTDDASSLYRKITDSALVQIEEFWPKIINESFSLKKQNHAQSNTWRKRSMSDGEIDFRMSSRGIYNLVRALTRPYVGAHVYYGGRNNSIWKVRECECEHIHLEPGQVLDVCNGEVKVKTFDGAIIILEHEFKHLPTTGEYV